jgi:double-stranded uracil-DNA glycosylase
MKRDGSGRAHALSHGFGPVSDARARLLILGSLPGRRSIADAEYYAQPRNAFWRIIGELAGAGPDLDYRQRLERMKAAGIALWDVLAAGERPGSLDSAIVRTSIVVNDIGDFLRQHPDVRLICCNGRTASQLYDRHVLPMLSAELQQIARVTLPSTSPANASVPYADKLLRWAEALQPVLRTTR